LCSWRTPKVESNNPLSKFDVFGLSTWRCSHELGGPYEPHENPDAKIRHDYLKVQSTILGVENQEYYSFGSIGNRSYKGPGMVYYNTENDIGIKCHTMICDDERFDEIVKSVAASYTPQYHIAACESPNKIDTPCIMGKRNCKSGVDDVLEKSKKIYFKKF
jgi:hypothetical protein